MEKELRNVVKRLLKEAAFNAYGIRRIAEDNGLLEDIMRFDIERVVAGYNVEFNAEREMVVWII